MIGKKLLVLEDGQIFHRKEISKDLYLEEWKNATIKNIKKYSYLGIVAIIRFYVHSLNFIKKQSEVLKIKVKNIIAKRSKNNEAKKVEPSKFLKMISEYKQKIRKIRHQIKEEENL